MKSQNGQPFEKKRVIVMPLRGEVQPKKDVKNEG